MLQQPTRASGLGARPAWLVQRRLGWWTPVFARALSSEERCSPRVRWMHTRTCPECGKKAEKGGVEVMNEACPRMWRKFHYLSDLHCPFFLKCHVREREGQDEVHHLWEPMPRIKGRS